LNFKKNEKEKKKKVFNLKGATVIFNGLFLTALEKTPLELFVWKKGGCGWSLLEKISGCRDHVNIEHTLNYLFFLSICWN